MKTKKNATTAKARNRRAATKAKAMVKVAKAFGRRPAPDGGRRVHDDHLQPGWRKRMPLFRGNDVEERDSFMPKPENAVVQTNRELAGHQL